VERVNVHTSSRARRTVLFHIVRSQQRHRTTRSNTAAHCYNRSQSPARRAPATAATAMTAKPTMFAPDTPSATAPLLKALADPAEDVLVVVPELPEEDPVFVTVMPVKADDGGSVGVMFGAVPGIAELVMVVEPEEVMLEVVAPMENVPLCAKTWLMFEMFTNWIE